MEEESSSVMDLSHHAKHGINVTKSFLTTRSQARKYRSKGDFTDSVSEVTPATSLTPYLHPFGTNGKGQQPSHRSKQIESSS